MSKFNKGDRVEVVSYPAAPSIVGLRGTVVNPRNNLGWVSVKFDDRDWDFSMRSTELKLVTNDENKPPVEVMNRRFADAAAELKGEHQNGVDLDELLLGMAMLLKLGAVRGNAKYDRAIAILGG